MFNMIQALENIVKYSKEFENHKISSNNTGIATIEGYGEVVYTRIHDAIKSIDECCEYIVINNGEISGFGEFGVDRPFTKAGLYKDSIFGEVYVYKATSFSKIDNLEGKLRKLKMLGVT